MLNNINSNIKRRILLGVRLFHVFLEDNQSELK